MSETIQMRRDTSANWTAVNPVLHQGEIGVETNTLKAKIGDGVTAWSSLAYWNPGSGSFVSPMTTLGDMIYENSTPAAARLAGPATPAGLWFLSSTPSGGVAQAPAWVQGLTLAAYLAPAVVTLTFGVTISVNAALGNDFRVTLTASTGTIANPTNPVDGQIIEFAIAQDATGSRTVAWGTAYDFGATGAPVLSTAASKVDLVGFKYHAGLSKWMCMGSALGF
jgi:hypothetical protein